MQNRSVLFKDSQQVSFGPFKYVFGQQTATNHNDILEPTVILANAQIQSAEKLFLTTVTGG